jgi:V/A-type H+-transporting ATPase subunit E
MGKRRSSSKILCQEIQEQSETEAAAILEQAEKEAEKMIQEAEIKAKKVRAEKRHEADVQAEHIQKRILSGLHLEMKKHHLKVREQFLVTIFQNVSERLERFRKTKRYAPFLKQQLMEGILALDTEKVQVIPGEVEKRLLTKAVLSQVEKEASKKGRKVKLSVSDQKLSESGLIMVSEDGRTRFDNRFSVRIKRLQDTIRLLVVKELLESFRDVEERK